MSGFGPLLKRLREERFMPQSKLAGMVNVSHSFVSRLESGNREPDRELVDALADALKLPPVDRSALAASAGFLPRDAATYILDFEPILADAMNFLTNADVPEQCKAQLRTMLRVSTEQAWMAAKGAQAA